MSTETEFKFILDKDDFDKALSNAEKAYGKMSPILQFNYYYDNDMYNLLAQDITLRVRQIGGELTLQRKIHKKRKESFTLSDEYEEKISKFPDRIDGAYTLKGTLVTYRRRIFLGSKTGHIDFDENYYLGVCDHEIEIETQTEPGHDPDNKADEIISQLGLTQKTAARGKSTRYFDRLFSLKQSKEGVI